MNQIQLAAIVSNAVARQLDVALRQHSSAIPRTSSLPPMMDAANVYGNQPPNPFIATPTLRNAVGNQPPLTTPPLPNAVGNQPPLTTPPLPDTVGNQPPLMFSTPTLKRTSSASSTEVQRSRSRSLSRSASRSSDDDGSRSSRKRRREEEELSSGEETMKYSSSSEDALDDEEQEPPLKKRPRVATQLAKDKKFITPHIEPVFDPYVEKRNSPLFRRMLKRTKNPDGTRSLKKNPDIVLPLFKRLVRPIL